MGGAIILNLQVIYIPSYMIFILLIPIWSFVTIKRYKKMKENLEEIDIEREIWLNTLIIYSIFIFSVTILPMKIRFKQIPPKVNMIPFIYFAKKTYYRYLSSGIISALVYWGNNIIGNFVLLLPLGYILPKLSVKFRNFRNIFSVIFITTLSIEGFQYISMYWGNRRTTDIDDIILNTVGGIIGYLIFKKELKIKEKRISKKS